MSRLFIILALVVSMLMLLGCGKPHVTTSQTPSTSSRGSSEGTPTASVDNFLVTRDTTARDVILQGFVGDATDTSQGKRVDLVQGDKHVTLLFVGTSLPILQTGDLIEADVTRVARDGAYVATHLTVLQEAPFKDLLARLRSAGVSVTADPVDNDRFGDLFGSDTTAAYRIGGPSDLLMVSKISAGEDVSSILASPFFEGKAGESPRARTNFYVYVGNGYVAGYLGHGRASAKVAVALAHVLGAPRQITHWDVGP